MDDFESVLNEWIEERKKPKALKPYVPPPKVELTTDQKRVVVEYMLGGVSKGIFEDRPEFWDGVIDVDGTYPSYRNATEEFVENLKQRILEDL